MFPGRQHELKAVSKRNESVITRVTKAHARCLMSPAILHLFANMAVKIGSSFQKRQPAHDTLKAPSVVFVL